MVGPIASNAGKPSSGSWLDTWMQRRRRHPQAFDCGVRVVEGTVPGEGSGWRYRDSAIDAHAPDGVIALNHGSGVTLRLRLADPIGPLDVRTRPDHVVVSAVEITTGALVHVSVPRGDLVSFGVDI